MKMENWKPISRRIEPWWIKWVAVVGLSVLMFFFIWGGMFLAAELKDEVNNVGGR
jgi:hypothetical protein